MSVGHWPSVPVRQRVRGSVCRCPSVRVGEGARGSSSQSVSVSVGGGGGGCPSLPIPGIQQALLLPLSQGQLPGTHSHQTHIWTVEHVHGTGMRPRTCARLTHMHTFTYTTHTCMHRRMHTRTQHTHAPPCNCACMHQTCACPHPPRAMSLSSRALRLNSDAICRGVRPRLLRASRSAPPVTSTSITLSWGHLQARCRGVSCRGRECRQGVCARASAGVCAWACKRACVRV